MLRRISPAKYFGRDLPGACLRFRTVRMKPCKTFLRAIGILLPSLLIFTACHHAKPMTKGNWRTLLDADHTNGWKMVGPGELKWEGGELVTYGGMGLLYYEREKWGDCRIRVVFKLSDENDNSGVFIRIAEPPGDPWDGVNHGYEVQIHNQGDFWHRTGCLYSFNQAKNEVNAKVGGWSTMLITLASKHTQVEVDGKLVTDFKEGQFVPEKKIWYEPNRGQRVNRGYIGLQNHGGEAHVHFKEVSVAPLR